MSTNEENNGENNWQNYGDIYNDYVLENNKKDFSKRKLRKIAYQFIDNKFPDKKKYKNKKYWLVFDPSESVRRSSNIYYSRLVLAYSKIEAITIIATDDDRDISEYDAIKQTLHTIDTMNKYFIESDSE